MTLIEEIYHQFDNQDEEYDFYIWLHQNRERIIEGEKLKREELKRSLLKGLPTKLGLRRKLLYIERYNNTK